MSFVRGYEAVREKLSKRNRYVMSCQSCASFSQEEGDTEEVCQDLNVMEFDLVHTPTSVYCSYWKPEGGIIENRSIVEVESYMSKYRKKGR